MASLLVPDKKAFIKWAIVAALIVICLLLPTSAVITAQVKIFFAITAFGLAASAFEVLPMPVIALTMPVLWILFKIADVSTVMSSWTNPVILMLIGTYFMAATLDDCGLLKRLAYFLMCLVKNNYLALLLMVTVVSVIINIVTSGRAHLIMAPLAAGLCRSLNVENKKMGIGLGATVIVAACTSHTCTYYSSSIPILLAKCGSNIDASLVTPVKVMLHTWPLIIPILATVLIYAKMYKPEEGIGDISYFKAELLAMGPVSRKEKINGAMLVILLVLLFTADLHKININLIFAITPFLVYLPGLGGATADTLKKYNYSMIFVCASFMAIGTVATSLGLGQAIADMFQGLLNGSTNIFYVLFVVLVFVFILNKLMTPLAITSLFMEPVSMVAVSLGFSCLPFVYSMNAFVDIIIFPYEHVAYLIVYTYGMMSMKNFIKVNAIRSAVMVVGFFALLVPYWLLIGLV